MPRTLRIAPPVSWTPLRQWAHSRPGPVKAGCIARRRTAPGAQFALIPGARSGIEPAWSCGQRDFQPGIRTGLTLGLDNARCSRFSASPMPSMPVLRDGNRSGFT